MVGTGRREASAARAVDEAELDEKAAVLEGHPPAQKVVTAELPEFGSLALPYDLYSADDIAHRVLYIEASRGCPFSCEFYLSSLDIPVRQAPLEAFLASLDRLLQRGARQLKFVDRTFNLNPKVSGTILEFLLERYQPGMFFHFEMVPDRLPEDLRQIIQRFPPGSLQFEVGIQSFNPEVGALIQRRQDYAKLEENLRFLRKRTGIRIHTDLIVGLPGENAFWFENPKGREGHWQRRVALDITDNESPMFADLTGDGRPELVCNSRGHFGYAEPDRSDPSRPAGRWVALDFRPARPLTLLRPLWAAWCGAVASGGLIFYNQWLLKLLLLFMLCDALLGAWRALWLQSDWRTALPHNLANARLWLMTSDYVPSSFIARVSRAISQRIRFVRTAVWPLIDSEIIGMCITGILALCIAIVLGLVPAILTGVALALALIEGQLGAERGMILRAIFEKSVH